MPRARLRSAPSANDVAMIASVAGDMTAPPTPCSARAADSRPLVFASAHEQRREREQPDAGPGTRAGARAGRPRGRRAAAAREGQRVRVDDPLEPGRGEPEAVADLRQRDVHDRDVEDHHELRKADDEEEQVLVRFAAESPVVVSAWFYPGTREGVILVVTAPLDGTSRRSELADFLRRRREALQPEDVGLPTAAPPHAGPAPRGGRGAGAHVDRLLHAARAGPRLAPRSRCSARSPGRCA